MPSPAQRQCPCHGKAHILGRCPICCTWCQVLILTLESRGQPGRVLLQQVEHDLLKWRHGLHWASQGPLMLAGRKGSGKHLAHLETCPSSQKPASLSCSHSSRRLKITSLLLLGAEPPRRSCCALHLTASPVGANSAEPCHCSISTSAQHAKKRTFCWPPAAAGGGCTSSTLLTSTSGCPIVMYVAASRLSCT